MIVFSNWFPPFDAVGPFGHEGVLPLSYNVRFSSPYHLFRKVFKTDSLDDLPSGADIAFTGGSNVQSF